MYFLIVNGVIRRVSVKIFRANAVRGSGSYFPVAPPSSSYAPVCARYEPIFVFSMPPSLPLELSDRIIDFLYDDKASLAQCSLVAHSWLPASRYHLFRCIELTCEDDLESYGSYFDMAPHGALDCATELRIIGSRSHPDRWSPQCCIILNTLLEIVERLPNVTSITISNVDIEYMVQSTEAEPPTRRALRSLVLERVSYSVLDTPDIPASERVLLRRLFGVFSMINTLHMINIRFSSFSGDPSERVDIPVKCWRVRTTGFPNARSAFLKFRPVGPLQKLSYEPLQLDEFPLLVEPHNIQSFRTVQTLELCLEQSVSRYMLYETSSWSSQ